MLEKLQITHQVQERNSKRYMSQSYVKDSECDRIINKVEYRTVKFLYF